MKRLVNRSLGFLILGALLLTGCLPPSPAATLPTAAATVTAVFTASPTVPAASPTPAPTQTTAPQQTSTPLSTAAPTLPAEAPITRIPLDGPSAETDAEVSGMAWYGDTLFLLPQYPRRAGSALYAISRDSITAFLDGQGPDTLTPQAVPINTGGLESRIRGFEGFEAITFHENTVYLTIEASPGNTMTSYLVRGTIQPDLSGITLDAASLVQAPVPAQITNFSNEALVVDARPGQAARLYVFFEANGTGALAEPSARVYDLELTDLGPVELYPLEFRLTDATTIDDQGRFWVSNFFFIIDMKIQPESDPLIEQFGLGETHADTVTVERLVELQLPQQPGGSITLTGEPPLQLELDPDLIPRNWEGLVRLDERGFLLVTDMFPETILAFVPGSSN